jgi:hypothetical protein
LLIEDDLPTVFKITTAVEDEIVIGPLRRGRWTWFDDADKQVCIVIEVCCVLAVGEFAEETAEAW